MAYCPQKAIQGAYLYLTILFWSMFSLKPQIITAVSTNFLVHLGAAKGLAIFLVAIAYNIVFVWAAYPILLGHLGL
jgi:hypothetical protein